MAVYLTPLVAPHLARSYNTPREPSPGARVNQIRSPSAPHAGEYAPDTGNRGENEARRGTNDEVADSEDEWHADDEEDCRGGKDDDDDDSDSEDGDDDSGQNGAARINASQRALGDIRLAEEVSACYWRHCDFLL